MIEEFEISDLSVLELSESDSAIIDVALDLMNRTQGQGLFGDSYLRKKISRSDAAVFIGRIGDEFVAVGCVEVIEDFGYYKPFDPNIAGTLQGKKVGSLCCLSVREELQRKGIGQALTKCRLRWLTAQGCDFALGVSWLSSLAHTSKRLFEKQGFEAMGEVEEFYKQDAIKHPFDCPGCQRQPCECSAILFGYDLEANQT